MRSSRNNASANAAARICLWMLLASLWLSTAAVKLADAQTPPSLTAEEKLEQDFTDPLTTLPQLLVRDSYSPATYGTHVQTNQVIIRPIIPRVPSFTLLPFVQLVRPTFAVVTVPSPRGGSRTEFGDMQLFDIAVLPWPRRESGWLIGIGPTFVFPNCDIQQRWPGRMAGWAGTRSDLQGHSRVVDRIHRSESRFLCVHFAQARAGQHAPDPARHGAPSLRQVVPSVCRSELDDRMAPPHSNNAAFKHRHRQDVRAFRPASDELLRHGTMDRLSPVRSFYATDNDKLRIDDGLS